MVFEFGLRFDLVFVLVMMFVLVFEFGLRFDLVFVLVFVLALVFEFGFVLALVIRQDMLRHKLDNFHR
jgi:hypothetical protein